MPAPRDLVDALRPRGAAWGLRFEPLARAEAVDRLRLRFWAYCDVEGDYREVFGEYYRARPAVEGATVPLIVASPILAGPIDDYLATRYFCEGAAAAGMSSFFLYQEEIILDGARDAFDLERRIRQNVRDNILAIDLFCRLHEVAADRLGSLGISFGAIKNVVLVAAEPRLRANVLAMAGTDMPRILLESREQLVLDYLDSRLDRDGLDAIEVAAEMARYVRARPGVLAPGISPDRVLLILGTLDDKVPYASGVALREQLGGAETLLFPLGHYTSVLVAPWARSRAIGWLAERLQPRGGS